MSAPAADEQLPSAADLRASLTDDTTTSPPMETAHSAAPTNQASQPSSAPGSRSATPVPAPVIEETKAATPVNEKASSGGWGSLWGGWVDTVKKQSEAVVDIYKRDISEFVAVVASESSSQFDKITHTIKDSIADITSPEEPTHPSDATASPDDPGSAARGTERRASAMTLGDISLAAAIPDATTPRKENAGEEEHGMDIGATLDDLADQADELLLKLGSGVSNFLSAAVTIIPGQITSTPGTKQKDAKPPAKRNIIFNRKTALITSLRADAATYVDPSADPRFKTFAATWDLGDKETAQIAKILDETPEMRVVLERLVPNEISYTTFWQRYFFRVAELEREEETRKQLLASAAAATAETSDKEDFSWGSEDEDEGDDNDEDKEKDQARPKRDENQHAEQVVQMVKVEDETEDADIAAPNVANAAAASSPAVSPKAPSKAASPHPPSTPPPPTAQLTTTTTSTSPSSPSSQTPQTPPSPPPPPRAPPTPTDDDSQHSFEVVNSVSTDHTPNSSNSSPSQSSAQPQQQKGEKVKTGREEDDGEEGWGEWE
ncbi:hypothetical protein DFJ77DRAFT_114795 [Powellomyces hirtus]|nr:hypothetical protein DFJ77DRAFT_114795 [Powellomyces hirtus]